VEGVWTKGMRGGSLYQLEITQSSKVDCEILERLGGLVDNEDV
jgi:hypothetical protein